MFDQVQDMDRCIFNIHVPPNNSKIDICPKLDANMKVVYDMGNPVMAPAGSTAVREAIEGSNRSSGSTDTSTRAAARRRSAGRCA